MNMDHEEFIVIPKFGEDAQMTRNEFFPSPNTPPRSGRDFNTATPARPTISTPSFARPFPRSNVVAPPFTSKEGCPCSGCTARQRENPRASFHARPSTYSTGASIAANVAANTSGGLESIEQSNMQRRTFTGFYPKNRTSRQHYIRTEGQTSQSNNSSSQMITKNDRGASDRSFGTRSENIDSLRTRIHTMINEVKMLLQQKLREEVKTHGWGLTIVAGVTFVITFLLMIAFIYLMGFLARDVSGYVESSPAKSMRCYGLMEIGGIIDFNCTETKR